MSREKQSCTMPAHFETTQRLRFQHLPLLRLPRTVIPHWEVLLHLRSLFASLLRSVRTPPVRDYKKTYFFCHALPQNPTPPFPSFPPFSLSPLFTSNTPHWFYAEMHQWRSSAMLKTNTGPLLCHQFALSPIQKDDSYKIHDFGQNYTFRRHITVKYCFALGVIFYKSILTWHVRFELCTLHAQGSQLAKYSSACQSF